MVYFVRNTTKNFIQKFKDISINGLPLDLCPVVEENPNANTLEEYVQNILMMENEDAQGFLLNMVPIVFRINVFIVNIDTGMRSRVSLSETNHIERGGGQVQYPRVSGKVRRYLRRGPRQLEFP